jgi:hypothetical protein
MWKNAARRHQCRMARVACETDLQTALFAEALPSGALETTN